MKQISMDRINVMFVYTTIVIVITSTDPISIKCGPIKKCNCLWYPTNPTNITMDCSNQGLTSLGEICETVGNTTHLIANSNHINGINDSEFVGCQELLTLSLKNNTISYLNLTTFEQLKTLRTLDLSNNFLPIYRSDTGHLFESLIDLETLALNGNRVNTSDKDQWYPDLSGNKNLSTLYIDGLPETDISTNVFPNVSNLKTLVMNGFDGTCEIEYISDTFFKFLINLEILSIAKCGIVVTEINAFSALRNLCWLDISLNRRLGLTGLYNISYSLQHTKITFMNYSHMHDIFGLGTIVTKRDICFLRNTNLREIALDGNKLQLFEANALQLWPPTLQVIHINDNVFTFGAYLLQVGCMSNLTNYYGSFQNRFHDTGRYRYQEYQNNKYKPMSVYLKSCPYLNDSYLRNVSDHTENCKFFEPNDTVMNYPAVPKTLKTILANNCNMVFYVSSFVIIPFQNNIEYVDVSGNMLTSFSGPFGPLPKLKYLNLSRNYCSEINRKFFEYTKLLENLQMHSNLLGFLLLNDTFKDVFRDLINLKTLNLSMNKISSLHPKLFEGLQNLETIDLSSNTMDKWLLDVDTMTNLTHVNLRSNAFQSLPNQLTSHLERASQRRGTSFSIDLRNNPLRYGCQTRHFLNWMVDHKSSFVHFEEYVFIDDDGEHIYSHDIDIKVMDLHKICQSYTVWIVISAVGVSVALSIIIGGFVYRNRWKLRYFMYMSKQRFYGYVKVPNAEPLENYKYDAFISYAAENIRFVKDHVIPNIERDGISLCIHQRDFLPGNAIADNIIDAIKGSRKTVILLTKYFLKKKWCLYELNMARMENIYSRDGRGFLVIVMLEPVPTKDMPIELIEYIQTESYLEYTTDNEGEQLFWNNFRDAVIHR